MKKRDHLSIILEKYKPHIVSISEANYDIAKNDNNCPFLEYNIKYIYQKDNLNNSRHIVLIDNKLNYKRLNDLESRHYCTIWIEILNKNKNT